MFASFCFDAVSWWCEGTDGMGRIEAIRACVAHLRVVHVVEAQTTDVVAIFHRHGREQLFDRVDLVGDLAVEDGAVDQVCFDLLALETVETDVPRRVDQLADVRAVVLIRNETDDVCWFRHAEYFFCSSAWGLRSNLRGLSISGRNGSLVGFLGRLGTVLLHYQK
jgi:hypothetical protein